MRAREEDRAASKNIEVQARSADTRQLPGPRGSDGKSLSALGRRSSAMTDFAQQSQAYAKENPCLHWLLGFVDREEGETLAIDGELDKSIDALTLAIEKGGDYSGFYFSRGESYLHRERYQEALADFERANELSPQDPELIVRRAATFATAGAAQRYARGFEIRRHLRGARRLLDSALRLGGECGERAGAIRASRARTVAIRGIALIYGRRWPSTTGREARPAHTRPSRFMLAAIA